MWSGRLASLVSLTEQYRAYPHLVLEGRCRREQQQGIREFNLTHACTQTHPQNIRTHTVIGMCNLCPQSAVELFLFHSSLPPMYDVLDTEFHAAVYMGTSECVRMMYPRID